MRFEISDPDGLGIIVSIADGNVTIAIDDGQDEYLIVTSSINPINVDVYENGKFVFSETLENNITYIKLIRLGKIVRVESEIIKSSEVMLIKKTILPKHINVEFKK